MPNLTGKTLIILCQMPIFMGKPLYSDVESLNLPILNPILSLYDCPNIPIFVPKLQVYSSHIITYLAPKIFHKMVFKYLRNVP